MEAVQMRHLYEAGKTIVEISTQSGVPVTTVRRRLKSAETVIRTDRTRNSATRMARSGYDPAQLQEWTQQGLTCGEIGALLGKDAEQVRRAMARRGVPRGAAKPRPEKNAFWTGGVAVDKHGYLLLHRPDHPYATKGGYVREHRLVMEQELGRYLLPEEVVDHRNGDTSDNRPENLRHFASNGEHLRATRTGRPKLGPRERALLTRWAIQRAERRASAIRSGSGSGAGPSR